MVADGEAQLCISEVSLGLLIYLSFDRYKLADGKGKLMVFVASCEVLSGRKEALLNFMNSNFVDKENGLQNFIAVANEVDLIVTRDKKGFLPSEGKIPLLSPEEFF